jgi:sugar lactone lactonase YvrE
MRIEVEAGAADTLGEGPVWLSASERLLRVDIHEPAIVLRDLHAHREARHRVGAHVGFALPARDGAIVAGVGRTLLRFEDPGAPPTPLAEVERGQPGNRFNDAAVDARGRLWAGTMSTSRTPGAAALYRVERDTPPAVALPGATISNGLDWNLDGTRLYYVDSMTQRIDAIDFDADRGRLGKRRPFVSVEPADGLPDGLCVDADGGIWLALFGGGAIRRYRPDGRLDAHVALPVTNPTSLAFAGPGLGELYVTSARHRLSAGQLASEPLAGSLLRLRPGVSGRPTTAFDAG